MDKVSYRRFQSLFAFAKAVDWSRVHLKETCLWAIALIDAKAEDPIKSAENSLQCLGDFFIAAVRSSDFREED